MKPENARQKRLNATTNVGQREACDDVPFCIKQVRFAEEEAEFLPFIFLNDEEAAFDEDVARAAAQALQALQLTLECLDLPTRTRPSDLSSAQPRSPVFLTLSSSILFTLVRFATLKIAGIG